MNNHQLHLFFFFISIHLSTPTTTDKYKYSVGLDVNLMDGVHIHHDADPMRYLHNTNKTYGLGYTIGVLRDNVNLYAELDSPTVRSIPSNYTFYFYNDNNKFYIRNSMCNFLCVDVCGVAFMSPVRYKHHCKFHINSTHTGNISIFSVNNNGKRRDFKFDSIHNILKMSMTTTDTEEYPFVFKNGPIHHHNRCQPIARTVQQTLVVNTGECTPTLKKNKHNNGVEVSVKKDDHQYYTMQTIDDDDDDSQFIQRHHLFVKHYISPGVYVLQDAITCKFVCQNSECGVYMSNVNNGQCKIHVMTNRDNSFYVRFYNNNYNLMYNTTTNELSYAHSKKSRVKLVPMHRNKDTHRYMCNNLEANSREYDDESTKECIKLKKNTASALSFSIPNIVFFLMLSYNNTSENKQ